MIKVYLKRGAPNYKEKRLISAIEKALEKKFAENPGLASSFKPATNFDELKAIHNEYCIEDVSFTEVGEDGKEKASADNGDDITPSVEDQHKEFLKSASETVEETSSGPVPDPFNSSAPIERDYVMDTGFIEDDKKETEVKTSFEEPTDFKSSFEMPSDEDEKGGSKTSSSSPKKEAKAKTDPINPAFNDMDNGKKKRSTKKMARLIIEGVSLLAERGCIWWTTKDITDDKLAEYELEDSMDLDILLTLDNNQQQPVREWFRSKVVEADTLFKISKDDKDDLVDSLYEVMLEKGIAPTPMQELIMNAVKTFILDMGLKAFALSSQIKGVLTQLKTMHADNANVTRTIVDDGGVGLGDVDNGGGVEENQNPAMSTELTTTTTN